MVWQREVLGYKYQTVATNLNVDLSTVWRVVRQFQNFGCIDKKHFLKCISEAYSSTRATLHCVLMNPGIYTWEIQQDLYQTTGTEISPSAICRFFQRVGFSRQKLKLEAKQRDDFLRAQFSCDVAMYKPEMLIFLDETGSDKRNSLRKYGYSLRGKPAVSQKLLVQGKHVSAIAVMSMCGMLDIKIVEGTVDGDTVT